MPQQWAARGLADAVRAGSVARTVAILDRGVVDVDQRSPEGYTPLMLACFRRNSRIVKILVNKGANVSLVNDGGFNALHVAVQEGHLAVTKLLLKAGAELDAKTTSTGCTSLNLAAEHGRTEVLRVLIEAGADPNSRAADSSTPLYIAAHHGYVEAVKLLLRANADPLLTFSQQSSLPSQVPLDTAAEKGHVEVVRELIQHVGIEGCGGVTGGFDALGLALSSQQLEIMRMLTRAGVVDTGAALVLGALSGSESAVRFLLQQQEWKASGAGEAYVDFRDHYGATPLVSAIQGCRPCSPRIAKALVDAGADITTTVRVANAGGHVLFDGTALAFTNLRIREKKVGGKDATKEQMHTLEAIRRLLMRAEAVDAVSWLWASNAPSTAEEGSNTFETTPTPLASMLPILRRRAGRPRVLLAALFRNGEKP